MMTNRQGGVSQLEVLLVITLILVMISTLLQALQLFYDDSEQVQVETLLEGLGSSINTRVTEQIVQGELSALANYAGSNPIRMLAVEPANYSGEYNETGTKLQPGHWYFNTQFRHLIYQLRDSEKIAKQGGSPEIIKFYLRLRYRDKNNNQRYDKGIDDAYGLALEPVYSYRWLKQ